MQPSFLKLTLSLAAATALSTASASAQATSPFGLEFIEGNSSHTALFGPIARRFQQVDATIAAGGARTISSIAFRREGTQTTPTATPRTFDLTIVMGHGAATAVSPFFTNNFDDTPVTVFATQQVALPDWSGAPAATPEAFDLVVTLDIPFAYDGVRPLVWELTIENSTGFGLVRIDRQVNAFVSTRSTQVTPGCTVGGSSTPFANRIDGFNYGPGSPAGQRLILSAGGAPNDSPVVIDICLASAPIPFPGLCASFSADIIVTLGMGISSATGFVPDLTLDIPYNPLLETLPFQTQALAIDLTQPGLPVAVSDVQVVLLPPPATTLDCHYILAGPGATVGTLFPNRGDIVLFN